MIAFKKVSKAYKDALKHLVHELRLKYCGRTISRHGNHIKVTQAKSALGLECMSIDLDGRTLESALTGTPRSLDTEACWDSCCGWDSSLGQTCALVCLWLPKH